MPKRKFPSKAGRKAADQEATMLAFSGHWEVESESTNGQRESKVFQSDLRGLKLALHGMKLLGWDHLDKMEQSEIKDEIDDCEDKRYMQWGIEGSSYHFDFTIYPCDQNKILPEDMDEKELRKQVVAIVKKVGRDSLAQIYRQYIGT